MIVLIGGEKGGTGKTTLATNIAAMRAGEGRDVLLIDTDTQGSAAMWAQIRHEERIEPRITCVSVHGKGVSTEVRNLAPRFDDVVIDSGGRDSIELRQAMLVAQVMIIPARPSQFDLHGLAAVAQVVEEARGFNPTLVARVVVNGAPTNASTTDAQDMREVIAGMPGLELSQATIRDRLSFRRAARDGRSVSEHLPADSKARAEITCLFKEIFDER
jgi:chromosome partitioning protein